MDGPAKRHSEGRAVRIRASRLATCVRWGCFNNHPYSFFTACACGRRWCLDRDQSSLRLPLVHHHGLPQVCCSLDSQRASIRILLWRPSRHRPVHLDSSQRHETRMRSPSYTPRTMLIGHRRTARNAASSPSISTPTVHASHSREMR